jgi:hypothetical protein
VSFLNSRRFKEAKYGRLYVPSIIFGVQETFPEEEGRLDGLLREVTSNKVERSKD